MAYKSLCSAKVDLTCSLHSSAQLEKQPQVQGASRPEWFVDVGSWVTQICTSS